jgi:hypothetical protein
LYFSAADCPYSANFGPEIGDFEMVLVSSARAAEFLEKPTGIVGLAASDACF